VASFQEPGDFHGEMEACIPYQSFYREDWVSRAIVDHAHAIFRWFPWGDGLSLLMGLTFVGWGRNFVD
jgi:hypothetical protein